MSFVLHFSGPAAFSQSVVLKPGGHPVVVGRDPEAAIYLPDAERLVSRRHAAVEWAQGGARIQVLSHNGINTDRGDYFSGDQVVLGDGESARIGAYSLLVALADAGAIDATAFSGMGTRPMPAGPDTRSLAGDDPLAQFASEWAAPPAAPAPLPTPAGTPVPSADRLALQALCRGLGVDAPPVLTNHGWERLGQSMRHVVQCLVAHLDTRHEFRKDNRAEDRTLLGAKEANPLQSPMPLKDLVNYLLFLPPGGGGLVPASRALQEAATDARSHDAGLRAAAKGLAEGALKEFDPAQLRGTLLKGRRSITALVDNARLWDLYASHYEARSDKVSDWADQLFNKYYMAAYLREVERLRRARTPAPPPRTH